MVLALGQYLCHEPPFGGAGTPERVLLVSVFPSGNHRVRFPVRVPALADTSGVAGHCWDTGGEFTGLNRRINHGGKQS